MRKMLKRFIFVILLLCFSFYPCIVHALPQGGALVDGSVDAPSVAGNDMTIKQNSDRAIINWQSYSIGEIESVTYNQTQGPLSIALNRVTGANPSHILGALNANGRIFLVNPNGIVFGVNSVVDVAGLVASTLDIDNTDFMDMDDQFTFTGPGATVVNYGTLRTLNNPGGYVALLGSSVKNVGTIQANLGKAVLASGEVMTLNLDPAGLISVVVDIDTGTDRNDNSEYAATNNVGTIVANGGKVILTAEILDNVFMSAVNNDGIIEANSLQLIDGQVLLTSNQNVELNGTIEATGAIDAYAQENIILGRPIDPLVLLEYVWNYLRGDRGYKFKEFGYYYGDGTLRVPLSIGTDIGKDILSPKSGSGVANLPGEPTGLYVTFDASLHGMGLLTFFEDPTLNPDIPDGLEHLDLVKLADTGTEYWWEDQLNNGDQDFNDAVINFVKTFTTLKPPPALLNAPNIFLTADNGSITQFSGDIYADNLMLNSRTGVSGTGGNGGILTRVNNLSAVNEYSNHIRVSNRGTLTIADLSGIDGLLPGVTGGFNGILNSAVGGEVNIEVLEGSGADLHVAAPVESSGPVIFNAEGNIDHTALGDVLIHNPYTLPGPPTNLTSPSHPINTPILNNGNIRIATTWGLPVSIPGYGFTGVAGGAYSMAPGSEIVTQGGNATITANGAVALALINAQNGNVVVTSNTAITDADLGVAPGDFDVIAHNIKLLAPGAGQEIDLGHPYEFSHLWNNTSNTEVDIVVDLFDTFFDAVSGDWSFAALSDVLNDGNWWFHVATIDGKVKSATVRLPFIIVSEIPPQPTPQPTLTPTEPKTRIYEARGPELRVYYEILDPSQFLGFEPSTKLGVYAYHPLTTADSSAFDDITLDAAAYEFIDGNINVNRPIPYFGLMEEEEKK